MRRVSRRLLIVGVMSAACVAAASIALGGAGVRGDGKHKGIWLAGDLHIHTTYSHDTYGGPDDDNTGLDEAYTLGWTVGEQGDIARSRGLAFLSITDHNDVRSVSDPAFGSAGLIWVPGYENSLAGHAQMIGIDHLLDRGAGQREDIERLIDEIHDLGGVFQINHPSDNNWIEHFGHEIVPDTVEVWNLGPWFYQHPFPSSNDNDSSLRFWDGFLDAGHEVAATGGSDNHWRSVTAVAGVGQPTTWVFAKDASVKSILQALREGRTTISWQPPAFDDTFVTLEADEDGGDKFKAMIGDRVPSGSSLRATVHGADGGFLRLVHDGSETLAIVPIDSDDFTFETDVPVESTWVRAEVFTDDAPEEREGLTVACDAIDGFFEMWPEDPREGDTTYCRNRLTMLALSSPIYFGIEPSPSPSPTAEPQG